MYLLILPIDNQLIKNDTADADKAAISGIVFKDTVIKQIISC